MFIECECLEWYICVVISQVFLNVFDLCGFMGKFKDKPTYLA
jgi:hypothetical protein